MTEARGSYGTAGDSLPGNTSHYDENGVDQWGYTAADKQKMLDTLAQRMAQEPGNMASLLVEYRRSEGITEETLRQRLEVTPEQFTRLCLCLLPREESFRDDVIRIAEVSGAKAGILANMVRQVQSLGQLPNRPIDTESTGATASEQKGVLNPFRAMAARDRTDEAARLNETTAEYYSQSAASRAEGEPADPDAPAESTTDTKPETPHDSETDESPSDPNP